MVLRAAASLLAAAVLLSAAGCGNNSSAGEKATCAAFARMEASNEAPEIQRLRTEMVAQARASNNETLSSEVAKFDNAATKGDVDLAGESVGAIRDECGRLGLGEKN